MKFEVYRSGLIMPRWRWRLVATNGQVVAQSQGYSRRIDALATVRSLRVNAAGATLEILEP